MSWDVVIGIETHVQLKTRNKIFSRASINNKSEPNTAVDFVDIGLPGTLPIFNPEVIEYIEPEVEMGEGCLSFPKINLYVKRHAKIRATWTNENGKKMDEKLYGYDARCFLHELDHLNGITFDNYVSPIEFKKAQEKAQAE